MCDEVPVDWLSDTVWEINESCSSTELSFL